MTSKGVSGVYCMFCRRPVLKGDHAVRIPRHITENELLVWESASGLHRDEIREFHRFHTSHFESKYLSSTAPTRPRLLPGAIPTINVKYSGELILVLVVRFFETLSTVLYQN